MKFKIGFLKLFHWNFAAGQFSTEVLLHLIGAEMSNIKEIPEILQSFQQENIYSIVSA